MKKYTVQLGFGKRHTIHAEDHKEARKKAR